MFRADDRSEMFSFGRNDPESARAGSVDVTEAVDFQPIPGVFTRLAGCVEKREFVGKRSVQLDVVTEDDFFLVVPIVHIEVFLVRREGESVWTGQVGTDELQFTVDQAIDA